MKAACREGKRTVRVKEVPDRRSSRGYEIFVDKVDNCDKVVLSA